MSKMNWFDVVSSLEQDTGDARQVESVIRRFALPSQGMVFSGKRATKEEMEEAKAWMISTPFPILAEEAWEVSFENAFNEAGLTLKQKRSPRCYAKKFIIHLKNNDWLSVTQSVKKPTVKELFLKRYNPDYVVDKSYCKDDNVKVHKQPPIHLDTNPNVYLPLYRSKFPEFSDEALLKIIQKELERIDEERRSCVNFLANRDKSPLCKASQRNWLMQMDRLLGWQFSQVQDLSQVGLNKIVPVVNFRVNMEDFETMDQYFIAKGRTEQQAKKAADDTVNFLKRYFREYGSRYKTATKIFYIEALVNTAKFLYTDITDDTQFANYQDIPVICKLAIFRQNLPKDPRKIQELLLTWEQSLAILLELKKRVDNDFNYLTRGNGKTERTKRSKKAVSRDMQRLLAFGLLVVVPPLRCRTLAQLEFGRTLKYGLKDNTGFQPWHLLADPTLARYYYDLKPDDYKTGKVYGDYFVEVPNKSFEDGSCFYDYLNRWFFDGYRDSLLEQQQTHQSMFVRPKNSNGANDAAGEPMRETHYSDLIYKITEQFTGMKIGPHAFRAIFRTHLINSGASRQELESLAFAMQHSPEMAASSYTFQTIQEKMAPILNFINLS